MEDLRRSKAIAWDRNPVLATTLNVGDLLLRKRACGEMQRIRSVTGSGQKGLIVQKLGHCTEDQS